MPRRRSHGAPAAFAAGLRSRCPRCGDGKLFAGYLVPVEKCEKCGLDMAFIDSGDGPAVFLILVVGLIVVGAALVTEVALQPPYWVHAVLWAPLAVGLPLVLLRPAKALMIAMQYKHKAAEGRVAD